MSDLLRAPRRPDRRSILATTVLTVLLLLFFTVPLLYLLSVSLMGRNETGQGC